MTIITAAEAAPSAERAAATAEALAALNPAPVAVTIGEAPKVELPTESADKPESVKIGTVFEYEKTGDAGLDYALNFVGKLGFGHDSPAVEAAMSGDFGLLKAELAALGAKASGYTEVVALAEAAFARSKEKASANEKALGEAAVKAAGSAERWGEVRAWAAGAADPTEKAQINAALAAGGVQARAAMEYLVRCYEKSTGGVKDPKAVATKSASGKPGESQGPLTAREYSTAVQDLARSLKGRDVEGTPQYRELQQRRLASQRQGR